MTKIIKCKKCGSQNLIVEQGYSDIFDESRLKCLNCGYIQQEDK